MTVWDRQKHYEATASECDIRSSAIDDLTQQSGGQTAKCRRVRRSTEGEDNDHDELNKEAHGNRRETSVSMQPACDVPSPIPTCAFIQFY